MQLTIYHDGRFWVAVVEVTDGENLTAYKHAFGSEPTDPEILEFVNKILPKLILENHSSRASIKIEKTNEFDKKRNPKRASREAAKATKVRGVSTFAQEVLRAQIENRKVEHKSISRQNKEEFKERKYALSREKAKKRHRGR
jgi:Protein of unknown function (DUF2992)